MRVAFLFIIIGFSQVALSQTIIQYEVTSNVQKQTDIFQNDTDIEGTIWENSALFTLESTDVNNWEFDISSSLSNFDYSVSGIEDENFLSLSALSRYAPKKQNFYIDILEELGQVPANRFQTSSVNNRRDSNVFAVSPYYFFKLNPVSRIEFNYQYIDYDIDSDTAATIFQDNDRIERLSSMSYSNQLNPVSSLTLVLNRKDVDFEGALGDENAQNQSRDFTQEDYMLRWTMNNRANDLSVGLGVFSVEDVDGNVAEDSQARVFYRRQISRLQSVDLQLFKGVAQLLTINTATGTIAVNQQNNAVTGAQSSRGGGAQYLYADSRFSLSLSYFENDLKGIFEQNEEFRRTHSFAINYSLSEIYNTFLPRTLTLSSSRTENEFNVIYSNVIETNVDLNELIYTHYTSRNWYYTVRIQDRKTGRLTTDLVESTEDGRSIIFGITYQGEM